MVLLHAMSMLTPVFYSPDFYKTMHHHIRRPCLLIRFLYSQIHSPYFLSPYLNLNFVSGINVGHIAAIKTTLMSITINSNMVFVFERQNMLPPKQNISTANNIAFHDSILSLISFLHQISVFVVILDALVPYTTCAFLMSLSFPLAPLTIHHSVIVQSRFAPPSASDTRIKKIWRSP